MQKAKIKFIIREKKDSRKRQEQGKRMVDQDQVMGADELEA